MRSPSLVALLAIASSCAAAAAPGPWQQYARPEEAGFSPAKLEAARQLAESAHSAAVVAIYRGHVVAAWGDVGRSFMAHSIRKSLVDALIGTAVGDGKLSLDATLADLRVDDEPPLLESEKAARVRDLLAARSGVYHPAAYASSDQDRDRPPRGSHAPGTSWYYNNWDFNALEAIYTQATGVDVFRGFAERVARPTGMEDFDPACGLEVLEPGRSHLPAHAFQLSARDLARFGQLFLDDGRVGAQQVLPAGWVRESWQVRSDLGQGTGYGYLWWIYAAGSLGERYPALDRATVYLARGTGGQALFVIPAAEMVVAHLADADRGRAVTGTQIWAIVEQLVAARTGAPAARPRLVAMEAKPFAGALPPQPPAPDLRPLGAAQLRELPGEYVLPAGGVVRVFAYASRLFIDVPEQGEAELFLAGGDDFFLRVEPSVRVVFARDGGGRVTGLQATIGSDRLAATRRLAEPRP